jgi:hypothetical protein
MNVHRSVSYRSQRISGPTAVLVSLRFGKTPALGPHMIRLLGEGEGPTARFDLAAHRAEVLAGVARANHELNGSLEVEAIEVVPSDSPGPGEAEQLAYEVAVAVLRGTV